MSEWHYMVLSRARGTNNYFHFAKAVIVLCNANSFSATDGFLNAFTELPQVTLMGEPSGGGSGATRTFQLSKTKLFIALSSMASYRPNGKTFDGNGIEVDVEILPVLSDFVDQTDSVLDAAVKRLRESKPTAP
jgi:C-terminal processing protease CtpA/Prc